MSKATLDNRHRNKDAEISAKHGHTLIRTLRKVYGQSFAVGYGTTQPVRLAGLIVARTGDTGCYGGTVVTMPSLSHSDCGSSVSFRDAELRSMMSIISV